MPKKTWQEKLENPPKGLPKVVKGPAKWQKRFGGRKVLIATPLLVDKIVRKIKKGKLITIGQIREKLAKSFKADATCPLTTGIFLRIISEVAEEDLKKGKKQASPYWRVVRDNGSLIEKFPQEARLQAKHLKKEGHKLTPSKGKQPPKVKGFEKHLQKT